MIAAIAVPVVIAIVGLLPAIAIPNFVNARNASQQAVCVAKLEAERWRKDRGAAENRKLKGEAAGRQ